MATKMAFVDKLAATLSERYVQHCNLLNPLYVSIQIGIRSFILAERRIVYQPAVANAKISEIPTAQRNDLPEICIQGDITSRGYTRQPRSLGALKGWKRTFVSLKTA